MVFQVKISIKDIERPIWRTLIVSEETTFEDLHIYLQIAFTWPDTASHLFLQGDVRIGSEIEDLFEGKETLDEEEVTLAEFLKNIGDRMTYINGEDDSWWHHEIILEQKAELPMDLPLPFCFSAEGNSLKDKEFDMEYNLESMTNEELVEYINEQFSEFYDDSFFDASEETEPDEEEWNELFDAADQVKNKKPWLELYDDQLIAIWSNELHDYAYCSIMGNAGESYGVTCFLGSRGLLSFFDIMDADPYEDNPALLFNQYSVTVDFNNREDLDEEEYDLIKNLGRKYRGKYQWPSFVSMVPDQLPWTINQEECLILTGILLKLDAFLSNTENLSEKVPSFGGNMLAINENEELILLSIEELIDEALQEPVLELDISEIEWKRMRKKVQPVNGKEVELALIQMGEPVQNTPDSRPFLPYILILVERETGAVLHYDLAESVYYAEGVQQAIYQLFDKLEVLPKTIYMIDDFFAVNAEPLFDKISIPLVKTDELEGVEQFVEMMMSEDGPF
ncbi:plasmid pRiA4b ORF-3 family protein [Oceanobacillus jeddahense]|uniref:plasmid pRiA4b ORF-3 family protein n=1 Tax=Oceanobacillus jeddahense TaxID=1462527 RepID=UPI0005961C1F|nr:plasmid pRiA4b ORF-3 family protein [Oceanobacillus jeddahense]